MNPSIEDLIKNPVYFVFLLLDREQPFYVGSTRSNTRLDAHLRVARYGHPGRKNDIIRRILAEGRELQWRKIAEGLTRDDALKLEGEAILASHREGGPLTNKRGPISEVKLLRDKVAVLERAAKADGFQLVGTISVTTGSKVRTTRN
jgi:hypothetical protein